MLHIYAAKPGYVAPIGPVMFYGEKPVLWAVLLAEAEFRSAVNAYTVSVWFKQL